MRREEKFGNVAASHIPLILRLCFAIPEALGRPGMSCCWMLNATPFLLAME